MKLIVKFLCVAIMLQVATPLVHGMDIQKEDEEQGVDQTENDSLLGKSPSCWQKLKGSLKKIGYGLGTAVFITGIIWGGIEIKKALRQPQSHHPTGLPSCPEIPWDYSYMECSGGYAEPPFRWAIIRCQAEILGGNFSVPVCQGGGGNDYVPVGWETYEHLKGHANCSKVLKHDEMVYLVMSPKGAAQARKRCDDKGFHYCEVGTEDGDFVGFAMPYRDSGCACNYIEWSDKVWTRSQLMESQECKPLADKARQLGKCKGPFASNIEPEQKNPKRKTSKRKRRNRHAQ